MKCKVIHTTPRLLESEINDWLNTGKYEINNILQSIQDNYIIVTIFYLDNKEIRIKKLNKLNKLNKKTV